MMRRLDMLALFAGCLALLITLTTCAHGAELECYTDEPKVYIFDLKDQVEGEYTVKVHHHTGKLKNVIHLFKIKNVANPNPSDDFLTKSYAQGRAYSMTYAMYCKVVKN